jgi:hypothetical protein
MVAAAPLAAVAWLPWEVGPLAIICLLSFLLSHVPHPCRPGPSLSFASYVDGRKVAILTDEEAEAKVAAKGGTLTLSPHGADVAASAAAAGLRSAVASARDRSDGGFVRALVCVLKVGTRAVCCRGQNTVGWWAAAAMLLSRVCCGALPSSALLTPVYAMRARPPAAHCHQRGVWPHPGGAGGSAAHRDGPGGGRCTPGGRARARELGAGDVTLCVVGT